MSAWIDFKELRTKLRMSDVLSHYKVELKVRGDRATGFCPLPTHSGKRHSPSFSVQLVRGIWQCFGCGAKGNVLDLACRLEGINPADPHNFRNAALTIADLFGIDTGEKDNKPASGAIRRRGNGAGSKKQEDELAPDTRPRSINAPLDFTLKKLDADHPYLRSRGFTAETISYFGLGFCNRGLLIGRIAIPLQDADGALIGYGGRLTDDSVIDENHPKYLFPSERERGGIIFEFKKSLFLYHGHRIAVPVDELILVEGFASVWWLWQHGFPNVVALMGSSCSEEQGRLILNLVTSTGRVSIFTDGDEAGARARASIFEQIGCERCCRWIKLAAGEQPTACGKDELCALLRSESQEGGL